MQSLDGMKRREHVLELSRLMIRAENPEHRLTILNIIQVKSTDITANLSSVQAISSIKSLQYVFLGFNHERIGQSFSADFGPFKKCFWL